MSSSLKLFRNTARQTLVSAAARVSPFSNAAVRRSVVPALWARSFSSGGFLPKEEVLERVSVVVKNFQNVDPAKVTGTSHFMNDLGLDSLDTVEVRASLPQRLSKPTDPRAAWRRYALSSGWAERKLETLAQKHGVEMEFELLFLGGGYS